MLKDVERRKYPTALRVWALRHKDEVWVDREAITPHIYIDADLKDYSWRYAQVTHDYNLTQ